MAAERRRKPEDRRQRFAAEDIDLALASRWGVDPYVVNHVWPAELYQRALNHMEAESDGAPQSDS